MKNRPAPSSTKIPSWQVKGVTFETREAVKAAARKSGVTMGEWVNKTLHDAATSTLSGQANLPAHRIEDQLDALTAKIDAMQQPFWARIFRKS